MGTWIVVLCDCHTHVCLLDVFSYAEVWVYLIYANNSSIETQKLPLVTLIILNRFWTH